MSFYAVAVPRRDYDHHHWRDNSGLGARFHHHPDDTIQGGSLCLSLCLLLLILSGQNKDRIKPEALLLSVGRYSYTN